MTPASAGLTFTPSTRSVIVGTQDVSGLDFIVTKAATTTTLASSVNPAVTGQAVTFTATVNVVAPGSGTPTGTVTFFDGTTALGTGPFNAARQATLTTSTLAVGAHAITAQYAGDANFTGSASAALSQVRSFADVPATHPFFTWIEALVNARITAGCSTSSPQYRPGAGVTRGRMALFLVRTFNLPM